MGMRCEVIAPSLTLPTLETDKRDDLKFTNSLHVNDLVAVNIPDSINEAIRDLCRGRR